MKALDIKDKIQYGLAIGYIVSGEDSALKEYVINNICETLPKEERDFSITTFDGKVEVNELINAASMVSFFADSRRIIIVKNFVKTLKGAEEEKLLQYLQNPNDDCSIIFVDCGNTLKKVSDYLVPVDCNRASVYELKQFANKLIEEQGYTVHNVTRQQDTLAELINMCNCDLGKVEQETKKVMLYTAETKVISMEDVKAIVCMNTENKVFDLTQAIQDGDKELALSLLDTMLKRGEKASALLAMISNSFRRTFWVANTNSTDEEMCKVLGIQDWALRKTKQSIAKARAKRRGYIPYLKGVLDLLNELEYKFKSGVISQEEALNLAMAHLLG